MNKKSINKTSQNKLALVAGGSAGHILPVIVLAQKWKDKNLNGKVTLFCSARKIDKKVIENKKLISTILPLSIDKLPGKKFWVYPLFFVLLIHSFFKSLYHLFRLKPQKLLTTGGLVSIPVCFAAKILRIPIELHELNAQPGKAALLLATISNQVFITFNCCKKYLEKYAPSKIELESYPIRFNNQDLKFSKEEIIEKLNEEEIIKFSKTKKTIFILGGSQGSIYLNEMFKSWITKNSQLSSKIQLIHQLGDSNKTEFDNLYTQYSIPAFTFSYNENIKDFYLLSDLVITRAGAGTLFELEFFKKKSLIIPLQTTSTDHQLLNAFEMVKKHPNLFFIQKQGDKIETLEKIINKNL